MKQKQHSEAWLSCYAIGGSGGKSSDAIAQPMLRITFQPVLRQLDAKEEDPIPGLNLELDSSMLHLFDAMHECLGSTFRSRSNMTIERCREVIGEWAPELQGFHTDVFHVGRQHILSKFFHRWLTTNESAVEYTRCLEKDACRSMAEILKDAAFPEMNRDEEREFYAMIDFMRDDIAATLGRFDLIEVWQGARHGPNGTASIKRADSFLDVKMQNISGSVCSLNHFSNYMYWDSSLRVLLELVLDTFRAGSVPSEWINDRTTLHFVPKQHDKLRSMCPEETTPAFFAQGVATSITKRLLRRNINLRTQSDLHTELTRIISMYPHLTDLATIDWSEASDRIWCWLCMLVLDADWYNYINDNCRSRFVQIVVGKLPTDLATKRNLEHWKDFYPEYALVGDVEYGSKHGKTRDILLVIEDKIFCSMGNPITFPLQTLIFHSFLTYCVTLTGKFGVFYSTEDQPQYPMDSADFVSSYGDDGIVPTTAMPHIKRLSKLLKWKLNDKKSFSHGDFRESCGVDYLAGMNIRPLMLKRPPIVTSASLEYNKKVVQAFLYIAANAAIEVCNNLEVGHIKILEWLEREHRAHRLGKICCVPPLDQDGSGLKVEMISAPTSTAFRTVIPAFYTGENQILDARKYHVPEYIDSSQRYKFRRLEVRTAERCVDGLMEAYYHNALKLPTPSIDAYNKSAYDFFKPLKAREVIDRNGNVSAKIISAIVKMTKYAPTWR